MIDGWFKSDYGIVYYLQSYHHAQYHESKSIGFAIDKTDMINAHNTIYLILTIFLKFYKMNY